MSLQKVVLIFLLSHLSLGAYDLYDNEYIKSERTMHYIYNNNKYVDKEKLPEIFVQDVRPENIEKAAFNYKLLYPIVRLDFFKIFNSDYYNKNKYVLVIKNPASDNDKLGLRFGISAGYSH